MQCIWPSAQAAQAREPATLIPLYCLAPGGRIVLVGDPKQLPATIISSVARKADLGRSLFERLQAVRAAPCCPSCGSGSYGSLGWRWS